MKIIRRFQDPSILLRRFLVIAAAGDDWNASRRLSDLLDETRAYLETVGAAPGDFGHCPEPVL